MRKKYQNPAALTINHAFDSKMLDLVANSYEIDKETARINKDRRTLSQKNFNSSLKTTGNTFFKSKEKTKNWTPKKSFHTLSETNYPKKQLLSIGMKTLSNPIKQDLSTSKKITTLRKNAPVLNNIDHEVTKSMLKNIRKNILSTSISPAQQAILEKTYKELLQKFSKS